MVPHVLVLAKEPRPGCVKTRLCPPCSPAEAAQVAEAALADTLQAVAASGAERRIVALDGAPGPWLPEGFEVVAQAHGPLERRLAAAWEAAAGPGLQIGMDTPQVTATDLDDALSALDRSDAVLGPALDGGWWLIGLHRPNRRVFSGIPTSRSDTGARQLARLRHLGFDVGVVPPQRDLDTFDDAVTIASAHPHLATAAAVATVLGVHASRSRAVRRGDPTSNALVAAKPHRFRAGRVNLSPESRK
ncbi:MAG: DUF2064 domain-containing protein [Acidimicrobiales bacterium]